jgi:hypothetical protein
MPVHKQSQRYEPLHHPAETHSVLLCCMQLTAAHTTLTEAATSRRRIKTYCQSSATKVRPNTQAYMQAYMSQVTPLSMHKHNSGQTWDPVFTSALQLSATQRQCHYVRSRVCHGGYPILQSDLEIHHCLLTQ